jgi:hypothetical protein
MFSNQAKLAISVSCYHFFSSIDHIVADNYIPISKDIVLIRKSTTEIGNEHFIINGTKIAYD